MVYSQIQSNKRKSVLLILVFFVIIILLGTFFDYIFNLGYTGLFIAFIFSVFSAIFSYFFGDKFVLKVSGAKEISKNQHPNLYNIIESLSLGSGLKTPKIYIMNDNSINAFATGRNPEHASIAVTTGCLNKLNKEELEGVLAHEISHIKNFDIRLMVLVSVLVGTIVIISDFFLRSFMFTNSDNNNKNINAILIIIGIIFAVLSPLIAQLIQLAISRKREYLADASGSLLTKNPQGLADALRKIANDHNQLKNATHATAHLFISNPFKRKQWLNDLFSTHPNIEYRIEKLENM